VTLTPTEHKLLALLVENRNRVLLHQEVLSRVWGEAYRDDHHLLRLHIANLRKKIEPDPASPRYVRTHRGLGYAFAPDVRAVSEATRR
jgi:two-component system KDP operon response regulator KdpE